MVKNFNDNNCIAVAGVEELNKSRLFSLQKDGIKMHHNSTECLDIEIIDEHLMTFNNT